MHPATERNGSRRSTEAGVRRRAEFYYQQFDTLARKIAAITLLVWKKGVRFDAEHLKQQAA